MKIDNYHSFNNITSETKEKIIRLFEVEWFGDGEYEGHCGFKDIVTNSKYVYIRYVNHTPETNQRPKNGDLLKGYLSIEGVHDAVKTDKEAVRYLSWDTVEGCLEVLDINRDGYAMSVLCQIPDADVYIIVSFEDPVELEIGDSFTFAGTPHINEGSCCHNKVIDGDRTIWIMDTK